MAKENLKRCIIIAGSPIADIDFIKSYIKENDYIICADRGYLYAKSAGIIPDLIIGDFDSYRDDLPDTEIIKLNTHKDDTDTEHCAKEAIKRDFKNIVLLCATGGRLDHTFANFTTLLYLNNHNIEGVIVNRNETVQVKSIGEYSYKNLKDVIFSVFPFGCDEAMVSYIGDCEYKAENLVLKASESKGLSNIFNCDNVTIKVLKGNILIFTEKLIK